MPKLCLIFFSCMPLVMAQAAGSITVSASRTIILQPDQVAFEIDVTTGPEASLDQVTANLQPLTLTADDLVSVGPLSMGKLRWIFKLLAPFSKLQDTLAAIQSVQQNLAGNGPFLLTFRVVGTQVSAATAASPPCSNADLISDARAQAQKFAAAAGMPLGAVLAVSNTSMAVGGYIGAYIPQGGFSFVYDRLPTLIEIGLPTPAFYVPSSPPLTCSATFKFALGS